MSTKPSRLNQSAGYVLMAGAVLIIFFMLHHPTLSSHEIENALEELRELSHINAAVHGSLIILMIAMIFGVSGLTHRLGNGNALPRAGLIFYGFGILGYCLAAVVSGFANDGVAQFYADGSSAELEIARGLLRMNWEFNQAFANAGAIGTSIGIGLIALAMLLRRGAIRWIGAFGLVAAAAPALLLTAGYLKLHLPGMTAVAVAQSVWYFASGSLMCFGPLKSTDQANKD